MLCYEGMSLVRYSRTSNLPLNVCFETSVLISCPREYTKKSLVTNKINIIVVRNKKLFIFSFFALKTDDRFSAVGIFLLYTTATALVTQ